MSELRAKFVKSLGVEFKGGDVTECVGNESVLTDSMARLYNGNAINNDDLFIKAFAPRKNTGEQPCGDGVPVQCILIGNEDFNGKACHVTWHNMGGPLQYCGVDTWKPDLDSLIKMQCEHDEKTIHVTAKTIDELKGEFKDGAEYSFTLREARKLNWQGIYRKERDAFFEPETNGNKICGSGQASNVLLINHAPTDGDKQPIYTQAMKDAGELPSVGMECMVLNNELHNARWEKCTILFIGMFKIVYDSESCSERVGLVDIIGNMEFKPIETPEQKAARELEIAKHKQASDVANLMGRNDKLGWIGIAKCLQKAGLLAEIK